MPRYTKALLQELLDHAYYAHNRAGAISEQNLDPLLVVYENSHRANLPMPRYTKALLQELLDHAYYAHNRAGAISEQNLDPLLVVYENSHRANLPAIALVCALFAYGSKARPPRSLTFPHFCKATRSPPQPLESLKKKIKPSVKTLSP